MSYKSFLTAASRNSLSGFEKWISTLAVSGLVSTRSMLSHVASRSAAAEKKSVCRRFSGTFTRNRRAVKWLMRADGRLGIRRAGLPGMPVTQLHDFIRRDRVVWGTSHALFGVVLGACLGHHVGGELAQLGGPLAAALVERDPGLEQALGRRPEIALQSRQEHRRHQAPCDTGQHRCHDRPEAPWTTPARSRFFLRHAQCFSRELSRLAATALAVGPSRPAWFPGWSSCSSSLFASATRSVVSSPIPATVSR